MRHFRFQISDPPAPVPWRAGVRFTARHAWEICLRLIVYGGIIAFCAVCWALIAAALLGGCSAYADSIPIVRWQIETSRPAPYALILLRGETVYLEPQYMSYGATVDISDVVEVVFRYRDSSLTNDWYYSVTGVVQVASQGIVRVTWTPACEAAADSYVYTVAAKTLGGNMLRAYGAIKLRDSVTGSVTNQPHVTTTFDWGAVEHINITNAPFLTDAELGQLQAAVAQLQSMTNMSGDVVGIPTNCEVAGLRHVPLDGWTPGAGEDRYAIIYDHATEKFVLGQVAAEGIASNLLLLSGTATNTDVAWNKIGMYRTLRPGYLPSAVINAGGEEIAWFDLFGVTMRKGGLHLLASDLEVNVAAYDGSASAPAYTWAADKDLGKYRLSYGGDYGEGYAVNSNLIWFWARDGIHLAPGADLYGADAYASTQTVAIISQRVANVEGYTNESHTAYSWGDHALGGYAGTGAVAAIQARTSFWDSAYSWGNHAGAGYASTGGLAGAAQWTNQILRWSSDGSYVTNYGTDMEAAITNATSGDTIAIGPGVYTYTVNDELPSIPAGVRIVGAGMRLTEIRVTPDSERAALRLRDNVVLCGLTVRNLGSAGFGLRSQGYTTNVYLIDVCAEGSLDAVKLTEQTNGTSYAWTLQRCELRSADTGIALDTGGGTIELRDCDIRITGPSANGYGVDISCDATGTVYGGSIVMDTIGDGAALFVASSSGLLDAYGVGIQVWGGAYGLWNGSGVLRESACLYTNAAGTITHGTLKTATATDAAECVPKSQLESYSYPLVGNPSNYAPQAYVDARWATNHFGATWAGEVTTGIVWWSLPLECSNTFYRLRSQCQIGSAGYQVVTKSSDALWSTATLLVDTQALATTTATNTGSWGVAAGTQIGLNVTNVTGCTSFWFLADSVRE